MTAPVDVVPEAAPARAVLSRVLTVVGELLVTTGAVLLLFVVYQLWWTNVQAASATDAVAEQLLREWQSPAVPLPTPQPTATVPGPPATAIPSPPRVPEGQAFALLYIPRLGDKVDGLPVMAGVGLDVLARGAGHYDSSAMPGQIGNFAVAAHRATHNEPFRDIDALRDGDLVHVQTRDAWFTYELTDDRIVLPTDTWVIAPDPFDPTAAPRERLITLTTCNPRWASYQRWVWWGRLVAERPAADGPPPGVTPRSA